MFGKIRQTSGRIIALSRLGLSSIFLLAIFIDPSQPLAIPNVVYVCLVLYIALAIHILVLTWNNWWLDNKLAIPQHALDLLIFTIIVFATEGYTSPFFTFSVFLLLSALIRWDWKQTARTAALVIALFLGAGFLAASLTLVEIDLQRLLIRGTYLAILSLLVIWFAYNRKADLDRYMHRPRLQGTKEPSRLLEQIIEQIANQTGAKQVLCLWQDEDELRVQKSGTDETTHAMLDLTMESFDEILNSLPRTPFLFDGAKARWVAGSAGGPQAGKFTGAACEFIRQSGIGEGLAVPVRLEQFECIVLAGGTPGLSVDDLALGAQLAEDIAFNYEQQSAHRLSLDATAAYTRLSIARDLHDSVAQLLAGLSFRLEALNRSGNSAGEMKADLEELLDILSVEQIQVRNLMSLIRDPSARILKSNIASDLGQLAKRLSEQWGIDCSLSDSGPIPGEAMLENEIGQLVREAVANAVRHGQARHVTINLLSTEAGIQLDIEDDGTGLPFAQPGSDLHVQPRSLRQRAEGLGGQLKAWSDGKGSTIRILLPERRQR